MHVRLWRESGSRNVMQVLILFLRAYTMFDISFSHDPVVRAAHMKVHHKPIIDEESNEHAD